MINSRTIKENFYFFLPIASITSISIIVAAFFLSTLFISQFTRILQAQEAERIESAIHLFSQVHFRSIPSFLSLMEEKPIQDFLYGRGDPRERALRALQILDRAWVNNELIDSVYLYSSVSGILSTRSGWEKDRCSDPELLPFLSKLGSYGTQLYYMRKTTLEGDKEPRNLFTIVFGSLPETKDRIRYALIVNLSEQRIRAVISDAASYSTLFILDKDRRFLSHPKPEFFGTAAEKDRRFTQILQSLTLRGAKTILGEDGERWIATWEDHPELPWRFVTLASEKTVFSPLFRVRNRVVITAGALLGIVLSVAYILSLRITKRVQRKNRILRVLREEMEEESSGEGVLHQNLIEPFFSHWKKPCYVALLVLEKTDGGQPGRIQFPDIEEFVEGQLHVVAGNADVIELSERTCFVIFEAEKEPQILLENVIREVEKKYSRTLGGYYSTNSLSILEFPHAYRSLLDAYRTDYLRSSGELVSIAIRNVEAGGEEKQERSLNRVDLKSLENAFRLGNHAEASHALQQIFCVLRSMPDPDFFRYILSILKKRIPELLQEDAEILLPGGIEGFRNRLESIEHLEDVEYLLFDIISRLHERSSLHSERRRQELIQKVKDIIEHRLSDKTLGTAVIASEVDLSVGYLRDLFKSFEGTSLLEYMGKRRIEYAKGLLYKTNIPVRDVCDRAGFLNYSYFITYFKKYTGLTPREYRERYRGENVNFPRSPNLP
jgi:AraC-like DNA-binding protein